MASPLAGHADAFAILVEQDGNGHERAGEKRKEGARPADTKVDVHGSRKQGERGAEHGTNKVISGQNARGVRRICVCEVIQDGVLEKANRQYSDGTTRCSEKCNSRKGVARRC